MGTIATFMASLACGVIGAVIGILALGVVVFLFIAGHAADREHAAPEVWRKHEPVDGPER